MTDDRARQQPVAAPGSPHGPVKPLAWSVIGLVDRLTVRDWRGTEKLPGADTGGVILAVNHISNVDPLVVGTFVARNGLWPRFLAKESLFGVPLLGAALRGIGQIPVHRRSAAARDALQHAVIALEQGGCVVIYPEGTITDDPLLWPMNGRSGAARLALQTGRPLIPVGQWGAERILYGKKRGWPRFLPRQRISMLVGDPVDLSDLRDRPVAEGARLATERLMDAITDLVAELRGS
ncbi:lysophospholipid acyltransferase family protein [Microlunatus soli]|uniref:lysophospholipid acyltransferase family protein n=1 Tax=Microlunatus soli TaxID=630515 RepID=UPI0012FB9BF9|nr:lysophospholipid acyltransferase family protein [Microlunatus soli]